MEDGPKLLPQWLRVSSSGLNHRGDISDTSKRGRPTAGFDTARSAAQADPWLAKNASGAAAALNGAVSVAPAQTQPDFGRAPDRGSLSDRSWKPRDDGYPSAAGSGRSGYASTGVKHSGRDDRDGLSLKPAGGFSAGRVYGRPGESEGGVRLDRGQDSWQLARSVSASARSAGNGGGIVGLGLGAGRGDDDSRSPLRVSGVATVSGDVVGIVAVPSKASFEAEFPSLRPAPSLGPAGPPGPPPQHVGAALSVATTSAPLLSAAAEASPGPLDTASSSTVVATLYRQTFLSSRTSSNWTSKLAEAPAAPTACPSTSPSQQTPLGVASQDDDAPPAAVCTPTLSPSPPPLAAAAGTITLAASAPAPVAPVPVVPPRPAGVWGTPAAVAAAPESGGAHASVAVVGAPPAVNRTRLDNLAVRQSKQLIPVISLGSGKSKASSLGMSAGGAAGGAGPRGTGGGPKPFHATGGLLKMPTGKRDEAAATGLGTAAIGGRVLTTSSTVILSKKASQPLDRPLTLTRTASASSSVVAGLVAAGAAAATAPNTCMAGVGGGGGVGSGSKSSAGTVTVTSTSAGLNAAAHTEGGGGGSPGGNGLRESAAAAARAAAANEQQEPPPPPPAIAEPEALSQPALSQRASSAPHSVLLQVSEEEEEEAFLRSLGWTGFEGDEGDGEDTGLTEEEIAAFREQQQRQQASSAGLFAATAPASKAVPAAVAAHRGAKLLIVAASYGSEQVSSSTDSDSECE